MRYADLREAYERYDPLAAFKAKDRDELKKAAGFYSEEQFIERIAGRRQEPRPTYVGFDADDTPVANFVNPDYIPRYPRVERADPSRQKLAAYRKYQRFRDSLRELYADLQRDRADDFVVLHTFTPDEIEVKADHDGNYDAYVRGRRVARAIVDLHVPGMPDDVRTIFKVAVFDPADRRQGVAHKIYQQIESDLAKRGLRLMPSGARTDDAKAFWKRYRPE